MVFTSYLFPVFLLVTIIAYYVCPAKFRWVILLLASIFFYVRAGIKFLPFILMTAIVSFLSAYFISKRLDRLNELADSNADKTIIKAEKEKVKKHNKATLLIALVVAIGYLIITKFGNTVITALLEAKDRDPAFMIIVPLGVSYYTFSSVGYVLDVYWKRYKAETNFFRYFLYLIYFPHILQGPIARFDRLGIQFKEEHPFNYTEICHGLQLMLWGYFQKLVIADRLGMFVSNVYSDCNNQFGFVLLIATLFYAVQIYTDFAGCMNIAMGISQIFGIKLEKNFRQPYFSQSVEEFWRRWHITLGAWFKDYLCMPVSTTKLSKELSKKARKKWGSQAGKNVTVIIALIAVWVCTGVWHGTGLNYIIWAVWQGGIIIFSFLMEKNFTSLKSFLKIDDTTNGFKLFRILRTFVLTGIIPRVITRAASLHDAGVIFRNMFSSFNIWVLFDESLFSHGLDRKNFYVGLLGIAILFTVSLFKEKGVSIRETIDARPIAIRWIIYLAAIVSVVVFGIYGSAYDAASFLYMGF